MSFFAWIFLGLIPGFVASKMVDLQRDGFDHGVVLGIVAAIGSGFVFSQSGAAGAGGFTPYSMCVALVGSLVVLGGYHVLFRRRVSA